MEIPIELFILGIIVPIALALFGFLRNPQIPAMLFFAGMFILFISVSTDSIIMTYLHNGTGDIVSYEVNSLFSGSRVSNGGSPQPQIKGEWLASSASQLTGDTINCMLFNVQKIGSPPVSVILTAGIFDGTTGADRKIFGNMNVTLIPPTAISPIEFCLPNGDTYIFQSNDIAGLRYLGGDVSNHIAQYRDTTNPFDGNNSLLRQCDIDLGSCVNTYTNSDVSGIFYLSGIANGVISPTFEFTETPKMIFALLGSIFMLSGALMVFKGEG